MLVAPRCSFALAAALLVVGCDKKEPDATPTPAADGATASKYTVSKGTGSFLIDAPLEKIKGATDDLKGSFAIDPKDPSKATGEIKIHLTALKTSTFDDAKKNAGQTEHALNWMEVGADSPADARAKYEWATFTITSVEVTPPGLAAVGATSFKGKAHGTLTLHGVSSPKTIAFTAAFSNPSLTELHVTSDAPVPVSMKEHGIMPRDKVGGFLNGALEKIGKKIDDNIQVSLDVTATKG